MDDDQTLDKLRDMTATLAALESEHLAFFKLSQDLFAIANFEGRFVKVNHAWTELLGWSEEELTSRPFVEFIHPEDRGKTAAEVVHLRDGTQTQNFTNRYVAKDESIHVLEWHSTAHPEAGLIYATARDVTEERKVVKELADSNRRRKALLYSSVDAIIITDEFGRVLDWNPAAERTFGITEPDAIGKDLANLIFTTSFAQEFIHALPRYVKGEHRRLEMTVRHKDGSPLSVELTIIRVDLDLSPMYKIFVRDIGGQALVLSGAARYRHILRSINDYLDEAKGHIALSVQRLDEVQKQIIDPPEERR